MMHGLHHFKAAKTVSVLSMMMLVAVCCVVQNQTATVESLLERVNSADYAHTDSTRQLLNELTLLNQRKKSDFITSQIKLLQARLLSSEGNNDSARVLLTESEFFFDSNPMYQYTVSHGNVLLTQAVVSQALAEYGLSNIQGREAKAIFARLKEIMLEATSLALIGNNCLMMHDYDCALKNYSEAQKVRMTNNLPLDHKIVINLGLVYHQIGQYEDALHTVKSGLKLDAVINGSRRGFVSLYTILGSIYLNQKRYDSALLYFERSKSAAEEVGLSMDINLANYRLAQFHAQMGNLKLTRKILTRLLKDPSTITDAEVQLLNAKTYYESGQLDSCILTAGTMLRKLGKDNQKESSIELATLLGKAFEKKMQRDSAIFYFTLSAASKDFVYGPSRQKSMSSLFAEMETLTKQKEIKLLQKQSSLQTMDNKILILSIAFGAVTALLTVVVIILNYVNRKRKHELLNYELQQKLDQHRSELDRQMSRILYINEGLIQVEAKLKKLKGTEPSHTQAIQQALNTIHINRTLEKEWDHFDNYFGNVHKGFFENFNARFPGLSILECRLAGLVRMNLTNTQIAGILNIEGSSVKVAKHRLKKKLELKEEDDLNAFLQSIGNGAEKLSTPL